MAFLPSPQYVMKKTNRVSVTSRRMRGHSFAGPGMRNSGAHRWPWACPRPSGHCQATAMPTHRWTCGRPDSWVHPSKERKGLCCTQKNNWGIAPDAPIRQRPFAAQVVAAPLAQAAPPAAHDGLNGDTVPNVEPCHAAGRAVALPHGSPPPPTTTPHSPPSRRPHGSPGPPPGHTPPQRPRAPVREAPRGGGPPGWFRAAGHSEARGTWEAGALTPPKK